MSRTHAKKDLRDDASDPRGIFDFLGKDVKLRIEPLENQAANSSMHRRAAIVVFAAGEYLEAFF